MIVIFLNEISPIYLCENILEKFILESSWNSMEISRIK